MPNGYLSLKKYIFGYFIHFNGVVILELKWFPVPLCPFQLFVIF